VRDQAPDEAAHDEERMKRTMLLAAMALTIAAVAQPVRAAEQDAVDRVSVAKKLFESYVRLEHAFDPSVADLYSDDAVIRNKRTYPTGQVREMTLPAAKYKDLLRAAMPLAKQRGDISTYSQISYTIEGDGVRIKADRYSELKKYHSPISILVKPSGAGVWLIFEELSESQP
jgi:hypothetical protein